MAYNELIKNFERVRDYMRAFYVYGFKSREEYDTKSARSYDNERRRIESWLGDYMSFHQDSSGKHVFLSVDSRRIPQNPLHKAFKAKSFTDNDIVLHFCLLDILQDGTACSSKEIIDRINDDYLAHFDVPFALDESTVRKKLKEYERLGLLSSSKQGREVRYSRTDHLSPDLDAWADALAFFSEAHPLGVVGSFLLDRLQNIPDVFRFKHHYILHTLDSDILCQLLLAIDEQRSIDLTARSLRSNIEYTCTICPLKIYVSTQTGRRYLLAYYPQQQHMSFFRLDAIRKITLKEPDPNFTAYMQWQEKFNQNLWGVSLGQSPNLDHIEMTIRHTRDERYIRQRLKREKRHGQIEYLDAETCRFTADVYDASEMLPWLRTFIGRIIDLRCTDPYVVETFRKDLAEMYAMYGGKTDAVQ